MSYWTGYAYEPWHLRYVGKDVAMDMHRRGIATLEQYYGYSPAPGY
jgi:D-alanyl-D-alanine carboxypeptidase